MQCPIDGTELKMADRSGVEVDYCPKCRGVWLDRGELDKIIERSAAVAPAYDEAYEEPRYADEQRRPRKKKSALGGLLDEIFDF